MLTTKFQFTWPSDLETFKNRPTRNKNCQWQPCLLTDQDKMRNLYRGPSIDASHQFWFIWPNVFKGNDLNKATNQKQELPMATMFVTGFIHFFVEQNQGIFKDFPGQKLVFKQLFLSICLTLPFFKWKCLYPVRKIMPKTVLTPLFRSFHTWQK